MARTLRAAPSGLRINIRLLTVTSHRPSSESAAPLNGMGLYMFAPFDNQLY
jgi:hypothetical protein